jgi:hypothetical protein
MPMSLPATAPAAATACRHQVACSSCGLRHDERILEVRQRDVRNLDTRALQDLVGGTPA